ncbi:MAG: N-6 DNA methylase [Candidatus Kapabacteria bacterium]|nr:N-6 DNA methylase [Candidatus Kapabacteria bacterium]
MFQSYFKAIQEKYLSDNESSEHTFRTALENLLKEFESQNSKRNLNIKHEPLKQNDSGRPDFKVSTSQNLTIGLIETKKIGEDLKKTLQSDQLTRYKQLSENIIVTDYLHFYLIKKGEPCFDSTLFSEYNLKDNRFKIEKSRIEELTKLFTLFFESEPETIFKTQDLALKLAEKAKFLRDYCQLELEAENDDETVLQGIYQAFQDTLLPLLDKKYFADIYAQTLTYGFFLAGLNCDNPKAQLDLNATYRLLPNTFPLIREMFRSFEDFPYSIIWSIEEILSILKVTDFAVIKTEFSEYRNKEQGFNDPFIFFYEDFLKHYDKSQRELRGVYYTPEPVVSFIVRSIEEILKDEFGIKDGFINKDVTLLDFATGTGTFLLQAFKLALEQASKLGDKQTVNKILNEQIISNFYGFELLVAPYVIAHLKISEFFKEQGYSIDSGKRLNIYLTNTLTNNEPHSFPTMPALSKEGKEANRIKNKEILIILGNPPYSGHSANKGDWLQESLKDYYQVDGKPLGEKNPKWLQDDYVKFIRFAQWKMDAVDKGIVGIITNHSYIDNPTFRGMRQSLMKSYDEIYIIDLHGNAKKKEKSPDGSKDENVFDIQQGVAIALFIKRNRKPKNCVVYQFDLFGLRAAKYKTLWELIKRKVQWNKTNPNSPFYLFKMRNEELLEKYNEGLSLQEIFNLNSVGIVTARDEFVIDANYEKLKKRIIEFKNLFISNQVIEQRYNLKENSKFKIDNSRKILNSYSKEEFENKFCKIHYRPFDIRYLFYDDSVIERMRKDIMLNVQQENSGLILNRNTKKIGQFDSVFISDVIIDAHIVDNIAYQFPLYILSNGEDKIFFGVKEPEVIYGAEYKTKSGLKKTENFKDTFRNFINSKYEKYSNAEEILGYIYAILHSPTYRSKYIEFLKIDFPRIPFTDNEALFRELSDIGMRLIDAHLMKDVPAEIECRCQGEGNNFKVERVEFEKKEQIPLSHPFPKGEIEENSPKEGYPNETELLNMSFLRMQESPSNDNQGIPASAGMTGDILVDPCSQATAWEQGLEERGGLRFGKVWINKDRYFENVPQEAWDFYIGGYQVLDKWLKERKKHEIILSSEDIQHFINIVNVLDNTIKTMQKIDDLTSDWI